MVVVEGLLHPLYFALLYPFSQAVMDCGILGGDENRCCANLNRFVTSCTGEGVRSDYEMDMRCRVDGSQEGRLSSCGRSHA